MKSEIVCNVAVIGAGTMGAGIAQVFAQSGCPVTLIDIDSAVLKKAQERIKSSVNAMCQGANIRTGLEDNIYYSKGVLAKSNAQLVERMVRLAREIGREIATVDEAREMMGIAS